MLGVVFGPMIAIFRRGIGGICLLKKWTSYNDFMNPYEPPESDPPEVTRQRTDEWVYPVIRVIFGLLAIAMFSRGIMLLFWPNPDFSTIPAFGAAALFTGISVFSGKEA